MKMFSVFDSKAEAYLQPFFMRSTGEAVRAFGDLVQGADNQFSKHPQDYVLFELGSWDELKASMEMLEAPHSLGVGIEFKKDENAV
jgi:hypothetical protein